MPGKDNGDGKAFHKIVSYTVVSKASKPIIRRKRVSAANAKNGLFSNGDDLFEPTSNGPGHRKRPLALGKSLRGGTFLCEVQEIGTMPKNNDFFPRQGKDAGMCG